MLILFLVHGTALNCKCYNKRFFFIVPGRNDLK